LARIFSIRKVVGFLPLCRRVSQDKLLLYIAVYAYLGEGTCRWINYCFILQYMLSSGEGASRCRSLGGDGAASPMVKRASKKKIKLLWQI
jgi:hypothetical protein